MTERVKECIYPEKDTCRDCEQSYDPSLFDGGCMLHYEKTAEGAENRIEKSK